MATYVILSRISPQALENPQELKKLASKVSAKIKKDCPGVVWKESFAVLGRYDVLDIIESDRQEDVAKVALILRSSGHESTETMLATPWKAFLETL